MSPLRHPAKRPVVPNPAKRSPETLNMDLGTVGYRATDWWSATVASEGSRGIVKTWCATSVGGRDQWVIVGEGGAVQLMKVWPFEVALWGRLQTASCCSGREAGVVSDEEKAPLRRQVGTRKANVSESLWMCRDD